MLKFSFPTFESKSVASFGLAQGSIDRLGRHGMAARRSPVEFGQSEKAFISGWALTRNPPISFDCVWILIDGAELRPANYGLPRVDVARVFSNEAVTNCGFDLVFTVENLEIGVHRLTVVGAVGEALFRFGEDAFFSVLAAPRPCVPSELRADRPARIRTLRDTLNLPRHDGRAPSAVRSGTSLVVDGWAMADQSNPPDETYVTLLGSAQAFRARTKRRAETEAGVFGNIEWMNSGFETYIDCLGMPPGVYEVCIETELDSRWTSYATGRWVEIMSTAEVWLPNALPVYVSTVEANVDSLLPRNIVQHQPIVLQGRFSAAVRAAAAFARFDHEISFALSFDEAKMGATQRHFAAILQPQLAIGHHELEVLLMDEHRAGCWLLASGSLQISPYELGNASRDTAERFG